MVYGIILSGGSGRRVGAEIPKQYIEINGKPLLYYTLNAFEKSKIDAVSIVASEEYLKYAVSEIVDKYHFKKVIRVCGGGEERFDSVRHGLEDLSDVAADEDIVLIHDGARPFIKPEEIDRMIREAEENGAAIAAMPVKDTIKISDDDGFVAATTIRKNTWQIQTPQAFRYGLIRSAYNEASAKLWKMPAESAAAESRCPDPFEQKKSGSKQKNEAAASGSTGALIKPGKLFTDDSMVLEALFPGQKIKLVPVSYENIKITTPEDLEVAKATLK